MTANVHVSHPCDGVVEFLLETGPRNFSTTQLHERLETELHRARNEGAMVVVIGSAVEGVFISHGHLGQVVGNLTGSHIDGDPRAPLRVQRELDTGPLVSIAAVDGQAWGGGAELAWACDFRVASEISTFGQPEVMLGLPPSGGATRIARLAGEAAARRLALDGRPISAAEAHRLGLVDRLVPPGGAIAAARDWAAWLTQRPEGTLALVKQAIVGGRDLPFREALRHETGTFVSRFAEEATVARVLAAQSRYDQGADSYEAFGIPRRIERRPVLARIRRLLVARNGD